MSQISTPLVLVTATHAGRSTFCFRALYQSLQYGKIFFVAIGRQVERGGHPLELFFLDRLAARVRRDGLGDQIGKVFLCASWLAAS